MRCKVQYLDFTTAPGLATLWDAQAADESRIPVRLAVDELGKVSVETLPR